MANLSSASVSVSTTIFTIPVVTDLHDAPCPDEGHCDGCPWQSVGGFCEQPASRRLFILNAFSLSMLQDSLWMDGRLAVRRLADDEARKLLEVCAEAKYRIVSGVGHADTARVFSGILGTEVPMNRVSVTFDGGDLLLVGQYSGPRLPEGATELPDGATIKWFTIQDTTAEYIGRVPDGAQWEKRPNPEKAGCFRPWRKKLADFIFRWVSK